MAEVESRGKQFVEDEDTINNINAVAKWISDENHSFGMLMCGQCGNGKTTISLALRTLIGYHSEKFGTKQFLRIVDAKEICQIAKTDYKAFKALCEVEMLAIDDLGIEPAEILDYGNSINPAIDLLTKRYQEQLFTIVTTNLAPKQIREHYGDRIADRFNEMFFKLVFNHNSYRK